MKELKDLPEDIYNLFDPENPHECNEENLEEFATKLKDLLRSRLNPEPREPTLRFSLLGQPDRKIWHTINKTPAEPIPNKTYLKFLFGDILELLLVFLSREAGHTVSHLQEPVEVNGVKGSADAVVDGVLVDFKSASPYGFKKFETNSVTEDDPFGYVQQLSGYAQVITPGQGPAWVAIDKVSGEICVSPLSLSISNSPEFDVVARIEHLKGVIASPEPPPPCHLPVPDGKSGNMKLDTGCSYCVYKKSCWPTARLFLYSTGPRWLTEVVRTPDVTEVSDW